jgi:hypothetical protein
LIILKMAGEVTHMTHGAVSRTPAMPLRGDRAAAIDDWRQP